MQGIQAARSGDTAKAIPLLASVVKNFPDSEQGWLWLGHCLEDKEKRRYCYQKVLSLNPSSQDAKKWLALLSPQPRTPENPRERLQAQAPAGQRAAGIPGKSQQAQPKIEKKQGNRQLQAITILLLIVSVSALVGYSYLGLDTELSVRLFGYPVSVPWLEAAAPNPVTPPDTPAAPEISPAALNTPTAAAVASTPIPPSPSPAGSSEVIDDLMEQSEKHIEQEEFYAAITTLDKITEMAPANDWAYYQKAACFYRLKNGDGFMARAQFNIAAALKNIDIAIQLNNTVAEYYFLRNSIYSELASVAEYAVDREYLLKIALENAQKAYALEPVENPYLRASLISGLVYSNQCEQALQELLPLIEQAPESDNLRGHLLQIQSQALACLGRLDEAIETIDASMQTNQNINAKKELKIGYLYQNKQYDEALALLKELFICCEYRSGMRYYIRAAIYYETGKKELALEDLELGKQNTWLRNGMLPFVEAQIALDSGKLQEGIRLLQIAEATFDPLFNSIKWETQNQLRELGSQPLQLIPSTPYQATPIP